MTPDGIALKKRIPRMYKTFLKQIRDETEKKRKENKKESIFSAN